MLTKILKNFGILLSFIPAAITVQASIYEYNMIKDSNNSYHVKLTSEAPHKSCAERDIEHFKVNSKADSFITSDAFFLGASDEFKTQINPTIPYDYIRVFNWSDNTNTGGVRVDYITGSKTVTMLAPGKVLDISLASLKTLGSLGKYLRVLNCQENIANGCGKSTNDKACIGIGFYKNKPPRGFQENLADNKVKISGDFSEQYCNSNDSSEYQKFTHYLDQDAGMVTENPYRLFGKQKVAVNVVNSADLDEIFVMNWSPENSGRTIRVRFKNDGVGEIYKVTKGASVGQWKSLAANTWSAPVEPGNQLALKVDHLKKLDSNNLEVIHCKDQNLATCGTSESTKACVMIGLTKKLSQEALAELEDW